MNIVVKCHPLRQKHWQWLRHEDNEVWYVASHEALARQLMQTHMHHVIIEAQSIEDAPFLAYLSRYHPEVKISVVTSHRIREAIHTFRQSSCALIDAEDPQQLRDMIANLNIQTEKYMEKQ